MSRQPGLERIVRNAALLGAACWAVDKAQSNSNIAIRVSQDISSGKHAAACEVRRAVPLRGIFNCLWHVQPCYVMHILSSYFEVISQLFVGQQTLSRAGGSNWGAKHCVTAIPSVFLWSCASGDPATRHLQWLLQQCLAIRLAALLLCCSRSLVSGWSVSSCKRLEGGCHSYTKSSHCCLR